LEELILPWVKFTWNEKDSLKSIQMERSNWDVQNWTWIRFGHWSKININLQSSWETGCLEHRHSIRSRKFQ